MTMKYSPYLGEWIVLPDGATISDEALRKAAMEYMASTTDSGETLFGLPIKVDNSLSLPKTVTIVFGGPLI